LSFRQIQNLQSSSEVSSREKKRIEQLLTVSELLNEKYSHQLDEDLIETILVAHSVQLNIGSKYLDDNRNESDYPNSYNPYYVNRRFLSTIKLTYTNNSAEVQRFRRDELSIVFQGNTFSPHDHQYFEQRLEYSRQLDNVFSFNMPEELVVGPAQSITRYIGVQPLPNGVDAFSVQYVSADIYESTEFKVDRIDETFKYVYKGFRVNDRNGIPKNMAQNDRYYILIHDGQVKPISDNEFYIHEDRISEESSICGFLHNSLTPTYSVLGDSSALIHSKSMLHCIPVDLSEAPQQIVDFSFN